MSLIPSGREVRSVLALAAPIIAMQLGMMLYGVVDTLFMGRLGPYAIAGVGLAHTSFIMLYIFGIGTLLGIDTLSSRAFGAGRRGACAAILAHALVLALAVASLLFLLLHGFGAFYRWMKVDPSVAATALRYLGIVKWMIFPALLFTACRQYLQSMDITRPLLWAVLFGNILNVLLDYALVFGRFGLPELGVEGCAIASVATMTLMTLLAAAAAAGQARRDGFDFRGWRVSVFKDLLRLGMPAGLQLFIEVSLFSLVTTLMARFGEAPTAAHQVTLNLVSITFMVPLGISMAAAVRVGQGIGREDPRSAVRSGQAAIFMGMAFMACSGMAFWLAPAFFVRLYTPDPAVVALGVVLLRIGALFQVFDGLQVVLTGALRGLGETRIPLLANLVGHALLGLPIGYWLAFHGGEGPRGLWIGMLTGLSSVSVLLYAIWRGRAFKLLERKS